MGFKEIKRFAWDTLSSPKTLGLLKLGAAIIAVVHAIEEFRETPSSKKTIGFRIDED